jgi:hypothetical protein
MKDKSKDAAKEWFFLYERGKEVGRSEIQKELEKLKAENQELNEYIMVREKEGDFQTYSNVGFSEKELNTLQEKGYVLID